MNLKTKLQRITILAVIALLWAVSPFGAYKGAGTNVRADDGLRDNQRYNKTYGKKTLSQYLEIDHDVYLSWLKSHDHDGYYLGTPYSGGDCRNPNGDCAGAYGSLNYAGVPGMNCNGFVWHALKSAVEKSGNKDISKVPSWSWSSAYYDNNLKRRYFRTKEEMLRSGFLEKGDIIFIWLHGEGIADGNNHVMIYYGNGKTDKCWHSIGLAYDNGIIIPEATCNAITKIGGCTPVVTCYTAIKMGHNKTTHLGSESLTIKKGKSKTLELKNNKKNVKWSVSNKKKVAMKVLKKNKVKLTAKKTGTVTVTAKVGNKKYKCRVLVKK